MPPTDDPAPGDPAPQWPDDGYRVEPVEPVAHGDWIDAEWADAELVDAELVAPEPPEVPPYLVVDGAVPHYEVVDEPDEVDEADAVDCWRCDHVAPPDAEGRCRRCEARVAEPRRQPRRKRREPFRAAPAPGPHEEHPIIPVVVVFALMLLTSVVWGWVLLSSNGKMTEDDLRGGTVFVEGVDTVLAVIGLVVAGRVALPPRRSDTVAVTWALSVPGLAALLVLNVAYTAAVRELLRFGGGPPPALPIDAINVLLVCVQPAVVEELFFRYVAFGVLYRATGLHSAVWVTAVMFAAAHLYNPLGMPYLFVVGVALGYARAGGGLALTVAMHFVHNLAVLALQGVQ
ncbi:lysostaphin resistance A-like protein [Gemmata sp.]|uniref:CPBP family intramembrane glutamic endopeptidase n=1 Tax=Gemmata sp. TaxID=1914242 RepID=UPI003F6ECF4C